MLMARWTITLATAFSLVLPGSPALAQAAGLSTRADAAAQAKPQAPAPQKPRPPAKPKKKRVPGKVLRRGVFTVSAGYQATANAFSQAYTWDMYAEQATATGSYPGRPGFLFDIGGGAAVWRDLAVGATLSYYTRNDAVSAALSLPSPFDFNLMRTAQAEAPGLTRSETALHVQLSWFAALTRSKRLQLAVAGGPSIFHVSQMFVSGANLDEAYPYDTVSVRGLTTASRSASAFGGNVQADVTWMLSRRVGLGGLVRFSRASASFDLPNNTTAQLKAGGLHAAAGVRVRF